MAQSPTSRRRLASFAVLAAAAGALIATSPPPIPTSVLHAAYNGTVAMEGSDEVRGTVTLELSPEALPVDDRRRSLKGEVTFTQGNSVTNVVVRPLGVVVDPDDDPDEGTAITWPIEAVCRVGEPCRRDFEVTLVPESRLSGSGSPVAFQALVTITYIEVDLVPVGATATWSASGGLAPTPGPSGQPTQP